MIASPQPPVSIILNRIIEPDPWHATRTDPMLPSIECFSHNGTLLASHAVATPMGVLFHRQGHIYKR